MNCDLPHTLYLADAEKKKTIIDDECIRLNEESLRKFNKKRQKEEWEKTDLSELLTEPADSGL